MGWSLTVSSYGVIFDMDGVLVDSYRAHFESWREMLRKHGLELTEPDFAATFGRTSREIIQHFFGNTVSEEDIAQWDADKETAYRRIIAADFPEMDGASILIRALHAAGFRLAIGSSGPPENVATVLENLPGGELFDAIVTGRDVEHGKPHPDVFLRAAERLRLPPERCAVIEDALPGVEAGLRAGATIIALTGTAARETLEERAHLVVDSLRELEPATIRQLLGAPSLR